MKTVFLMLQKIFPLKQLEGSINVTHKEYLSRVRTLCPSRTENQSSTHCDTSPNSPVAKKLNTYYKFMIVRNPLERLYSAFHEKISMPTHSYVYQSMQKLVLRYSDDHPNFTQFVRAFLAMDQLNDHHFLPMMENATLVQ